jgi:hypothetical protein
VDEIAILDATAKISKSVGHLLELGGVLHDGEISLVEVVELIEKIGGEGFTIAVEE